jgi:hypothetical protein
VIALKVQPELRINTEIQSQAKGRFGCYAALASYDELERRLRNARILCHTVNTQNVWANKFREQDFTRGRMRIRFIFNDNLD